MNTMYTYIYIYLKKKNIIKWTLPMQKITTPRNVLALTRDVQQWPSYLCAIHPSLHSFAWNGTNTFLFIYQYPTPHLDLVPPAKSTMLLFIVPLGVQ